MDFNACALIHVECQLLTYLTSDWSASISLTRYHKKEYEFIVTSLLYLLKRKHCLLLPKLPIVEADDLSYI